MVFSDEGNFLMKLWMIWKIVCVLILLVVDHVFETK